MTLQLSREESLLFLTCRPYLRLEDDRTLRALVGGELDWHHVLWRSEIFRTTSLLSYHLARLELLASIPEDIRTYLEAFSALSRTRTEALYSELGPILNAFDEYGIRYFLLKGVAVCPLVYPDPFIRPMLDIDFMVYPEDIDLARDLLFSLGYCHGLWHPDTNQVAELEYGPTDASEHHELPSLLRRVETASPVPAKIVPKSWRWRHIMCHLDRDRATFPVLVDLHFNLSIGFDLDDVWRGNFTALRFDRPVQMQSITAMVWFLAARLYNEAFQFNTLKLVMFGDVHALLHERRTNVDWDDLLKMASKYDMNAALYYVLAQMERLTNVGVPVAVIDALRPRPTEIPSGNDWGDLMPKLFSRAILHDVALA